MPGGGVKRQKRESETSNKAKENIKGLTRKDSKKKEESSQDENSDDHEEYEVERIEGHKINKENDDIEFYVKWKNYPRSDNTWESFEFFANDAPGLAIAYLGQVFNTMKVPKKVENFEKFKVENVEKIPDLAKTSSTNTFGGISNLKKTSSSVNENQGPLLVA